MSYNLFLDDTRNPNTFLLDIRTWVVVRNYGQFVDTVTRQGLPKFISFDHDLCFEHQPVAEQKPTDKIPYDAYREKTGHHCAKWLIEYCMKNNLPLPDYQVHSMNPVGKENILKLLEGFRSQWKPKEN